MTENTVQHSVVRSVEINLRIKLTGIPNITDEAIHHRIKDLADNASAYITGHGPLDCDVDYTLNIKHLADHVVRSYAPTPF